MGFFQTDKVKFTINLGDNQKAQISLQGGEVNQDSISWEENMSKIFIFFFIK